MRSYVEIWLLFRLTRTSRNGSGFVYYCIFYDAVNVADLLCVYTKKSRLVCMPEKRFQLFNTSSVRKVIKIRKKIFQFERTSDMVSPSK